MRVITRDFSKGLWVTSAQDELPPGTLRRCKGVRQLLQSSIRSRWGSTSLATIPNGDPPVGIFVFNGDRYCVTSNFIRLISGGTTSVKFGRISTVIRPLFTKMIPTIDTDVTAFPQGPEHVFFAGLSANSIGGIFNRKLSTSGRSTAIGLLPPPDGFTASAAPEISHVLYGFDNTNGLIASGFFPATIVTDRQVGSGAYQVTLAASSSAAIQVSFDSRVDLTQFFGVFSGDEDPITFWVKVNIPANLDLFQLSFAAKPSLDPAQFGNLFSGENYAYSILVDDQVLQSQTTGPSGVGDVPEFSQGKFNERQAAADTQQRYLNTLEPGVLGPDVAVGKAQEVLSALSVTKVPSTDNTWIQLRIPRSSFIPSGIDLGKGQFGWNSIFGFTIVIHTNANGPVIINFDEIAAVRGNGMVGTYQYLLTYKNSKTGTRSNPNPTAVIVGRVARNDVGLSNFPFNPSIDADLIEIWRTVGDGAVFFFDDTVPNTSTPQPHIDRTADFFGLSTAPHTKYLQAIELPLDNTPPPDTITDVTGPYLGRLFWCNDKNAGSHARVYFSPPGRAESIEGFLEVAGDDEQTQRTIVYNGALFTFTDRKVYEITGVGPFIAVEVLGVPGTLFKYTIVPTPYGIVYRAADGVRIFNGQTSSLAFPEGMVTLFRGESAPDSGYITAFSSINFIGVHACYHKDEYLISNGVTTFALNLRLGVWRDIGRGTTALFSDQGDLLASENGRVYVLEDPGVTSDFGSPIPFDIEIPGTLVENQSGVTKLVQRLYLDMNTMGTGIEVDIINALGQVTYTNPNVVASGRQLLEISLGLPHEVVSVRLTGTFIQPVEIFGVEFDVWIPEPAGFAGQ